MMFYSVFSLNSIPVSPSPSYWISVISHTAHIVSVHAPLSLFPGVNYTFLLDAFLSHLTPYSTGCCPILSLVKMTSFLCLFLPSSLTLFCTWKMPAFSVSVRLPLPSLHHRCPFNSLSLCLAHWQFHILSLKGLFDLSGHPSVSPGHEFGVLHGAGCLNIPREYK